MRKIAIALIMSVLFASQANAICTFGDTTPPTQIKNLAVTKFINDGEAQLEFTVPTDPSGSGIGGYDLRYRINQQITALNFGTSTRFPTDNIFPAVQGTKQRIVVTGLQPQTTYFFAIKAKDDCTNNKWSLVSNSPGLVTLRYGGMTIGITWEPGEVYTEPTCYIVEWGPKSRDYTMQQQTCDIQTWLQVDGEVDNFFSVIAYRVNDPALKSGWSNEICANNHTSETDGNAGICTPAP